MKNNNYTKEELEETVKSYLEMRQKEIAGESFVKKKYYHPEDIPEYMFVGEENI